MPANIAAIVAKKDKDCTREEHLDVCAWLTTFRYRDMTDDLVRLLHRLGWIEEDLLYPAPSMTEFYFVRSVSGGSVRVGVV
jgi:hypothetical protein